MNFVRYKIQFLIIQFQLNSNTSVLCCIDNENTSSVAFVSRSTETSRRSSNKKIVRSSHRRCSVKKGVLKNFTKFTVKHLCFPVNFVEFLRTPFFTEYRWWLFLHLRRFFKSKTQATSNTSYGVNFMGSVMSTNQRGVSLNPLVTNSNVRVTSSNP